MALYEPRNPDLHTVFATFLLYCWTPSNHLFFSYQYQTYYLKRRANTLIFKESKTEHCR